MVLISERKRLYFVTLSQHNGGWCDKQFWFTCRKFTLATTFCKYIGVLASVRYKILPGFENPIFGRLLAHACFADFRGIRRQPVTGVIKINYLLLDYF